MTQLLRICVNKKKTLVEINSDIACHAKTVEKWLIYGTFFLII